MSVSRESWQEALEEAERSAVPASDAITVSEFAELFGLSRLQASNRLKLLVDTGKAEATTKMIRRAGCGITSVPAYRLLRVPAKKKR